MEIRPLAKDEEYSEATSLVMETFCEFVAPYYSQKGIKSFTEYVSADGFFARFTVLGAYEGDSLAGVLAFDPAKRFIVSFFVRGKYHRLGIGKALFNKMKEILGEGDFRVNASPYAVGIYEKLGFKATYDQTEEDGILYTPMKYSAKK